MRIHAVCIFVMAWLLSGAVIADSSSPNLAAFYDRQMAIVAGKVYAWEDDDPPVMLPFSARQVGVGRDTFYALTTEGDLLAFDDVADRPVVMMGDIARFAAGDSGVLAITSDRTLWWLSDKRGQKLATDIADAAVGDSANYYITTSGDLFVKGRAHRGQYGDGRLTSTDQFVQTASDAVRITAHTGHAILLLANGDVMGTGGNIYGPVGKHGLGDKAVRWSRILSGAGAIATGSSHSLAILHNDMLVAWGRGYDTEPSPILKDVMAVAAGSRTTIALTRDNTLWQWDRGAAPQRVKLPKDR